MQYPLSDGCVLLGGPYEKWSKRDVYWIQSSILENCLCSSSFIHNFPSHLQMFYFTCRTYLSSHSIMSSDLEQSSQQCLCLRMFSLTHSGLSHLPMCTSPKQRRSCCWAGWMDLPPFVSDDHGVDESVWLQLCQKWSKLLSCSDKYTNLQTDSDLYVCYSPHLDKF